MSVQGLLKKAAGLEIRMICPLHSVIWREDLPWLIDKYLKWSSYTPEEKSVTIAYGSVYGHTEKAADILAGKLAARGITFDIRKVPADSAESFDAMIKKAKSELAAQ